MSERYSLVVRWGARRESAEACGARAFGFLMSLAAREAAFESWFETAWTRKKALERRVTLTRESLSDLFRRGVSITDYSRELDPELGFSVAIWNGAEDDESLALSMHCGCYAHVVPNSVVLDFPASGESLQRILDIDFQTFLVSEAAVHWEPDWVTVMTSPIWDRFDLPLESVHIGWLTFISSRYGKIPDVPPPSRVLPVEHRGAIIVTTDERMSADNPAHVEQGLRMIKILRTAGIIR